jgi:hypothetical protein
MFGDKKRIFAWLAAFLMASGVIFVVVFGDRSSRIHPDATAMARSLEEPSGRSAAVPKASQSAAPRMEPQPSQPPPLAPNSIPMRSYAMPALAGANQDDQEIVELAINNGGTRVLAKAKKQICLFELASGEVLQTFKRTTPLWHRNPGTEGMYISPDARVVASWTDPPDSGKNPQATFSFYEAETARFINTGRLEHDFNVDAGNVVFSPEGSTLLVAGTLRGKTSVQALSVASGMTTMLNLPLAGRPNGVLQILVSWPGRAAFLASWRGDRLADKHPSRLSILDLENSAERPLQSVDIEPFRGLWDRRVEVSPDGRLALVQDIEHKQCSHFEVVDLYNDQQIFKGTECDVSFPKACFTSDGQRFLVVRGPHYVVLHFNAGPGVPFKERVPATIQLYEVSSQKKIAEYTPPAAPGDLVLSGNGRKLAFSHGTHLFAVDFADAFQIEPLPAFSRPPDTVFTAR